MNSAAKVDRMVEQWKQNGQSKEEIIVQTAEAELGWPYVWGAVGAQCTPEKRKYYAGRKNCPPAEAELIISRCQALNGSGKSCSGCPFYPNNERVLIDDCQGWVKQLCSRVGISLSGGGCSSMWKNSANWESSGTIDTLPEQLCCVFWQNPKDPAVMEHIGFYIGNGWMIDCSGNVKKGKLSKKCTHWAIPKGLGGYTPMPAHRTIRQGDRGEDVKEMQQKLVDLGYNVGSTGADGIYGKNTKAAVVAFQKANGLTADGICGPLTWGKLLQDEPEPAEERYTATIRGLTKEAAKELKKQYPDAEIKVEG